MPAQITDTTPADTIELDKLHIYVQQKNEIHIVMAVNR